MSDYDRAIGFLRDRAPRPERRSEGRIGVAMREGAAAIAEVRCETSFVSQLDEFAGCVERIARIIVGSNQGQADTDAINDELDAIRNATGEYITLVGGEMRTGEAYIAAVSLDGRDGAIAGFIDQQLADRERATILTTIARGDIRLIPVRTLTNSLLHYSVGQAPTSWNREP